MSPTCERCGKAVEPDEVGEVFEDTGLCDDCTAYNDSRVVI